MRGFANLTHFSPPCPIGVYSLAHRGKPKGTLMGRA